MANVDRYDRKGTAKIMIKSLMLGCGPSWPRRSSTHLETYLDRIAFPNVDVVHDLNISPWPFENNSYDEIVALHLVEHLQSLIQFMDESWRILAPGGALYLTTPEAGSNYDLTHSDPTHVRCYRKHSFINYFSRSEAPKFGYTNNYWSILDIRVVDNCIAFLGTPIK